MTATSNEESGQSLKEHARLGLLRIHNLSKPKVTTKEPVQERTESASSSGEKSASCEAPTKKEVEYLKVKKPLHKSIFYQHSREGVKYWYEKPEAKTHDQKVPMGRKGTLLGLVDAPFK